MVELVRLGRLLRRNAQLGPGAGVDNILTEDDCNILLEDGVCVILLE